MNDKPTKEVILTLLEKWIKQRPGLDPADYGIYPYARNISESVKSYRSEMRHITQQGSDAKKLLSVVRSSGITSEELTAAFRAYSGRLELVHSDNGWNLEYCTGQYFPTEYRAAAAAVLALALWEYHRPDYMNDDHPGDSLRAMFRRNFGKRIQETWFS